ncbi:MAG: PEP-CTERM sorting domain-containing protein [Pirellulales bacterium]|nr:PEP-CTERM sorting domain-containing protein [Pirellulales bacterium]
MKNLTFAAVLLLTARVAQAQTGIYDFKAYSFANYGSPFYYVATTAKDLASAIDGGAMGGNWGSTTLDELFQIGQISFSDEYDLSSGLHVKFSAEAVHHEAEPLSTDPPGIGAKAFASNNQYIGPTTVIGESFVYLKHTVSINNPTTRDEYLKSYGFTTSLDGVINVSGDSIAQVGQAIRLTLDDGQSYTNSETLTVEGRILPYTFSYGRPGLFSDPPLTLTNSGPYGTELIAHSSHSMTIETLLYVRAQTGISVDRAAGTASTDFKNTMRVSNIQFFDENDQVIPGLQVVGSDGAVYPYNVVPEPSALMLFGVGSMGVLLARVRRTRRVWLGGVPNRSSTKSTFVNS